MTSPKRPRIFTFNAIGLFILGIAMLVLFSLGGCSTTGSTSNDSLINAGTVTDVASAAVLLDAYDDARDVLTRRLDSLPEHTALSLVELEVQIDQLVSGYKGIAAQPTSWIFIDQLLARTALLYTTGKVLVEPHVATMSLDDQMRLRRLDTAWAQTQAAYNRWKADPEARDRAELLESGIDFATALMLILGV